MHHLVILFTLHCNSVKALTIKLHRELEVPPGFRIIRTALTNVYNYRHYKDLSVTGVQLGSSLSHRTMSTRASEIVKLLTVTIDSNAHCTHLPFPQRL